MNTKLKLVYGASAHQGARAYQEDSYYWLQTEKKGCLGFVLADGMGGHAAGDVASQILVNTYQSIFCQDVPYDAPVTLLGESLNQGNKRIRESIRVQPELDGMGSTYLAGFICEKKLYWISGGDSPLYIFSCGKLRQLNEDHSMAPELQKLVEKGEMSQEQADSHPQRNALFSSVMGEPIEMIDQPETGISLEVGDVVIIASDGIQTLSKKEIEDVISHWQNVDSNTDLTDSLLQAVLNKKRPGQDNTTIMAAAFIAPRKLLDNTQEKYNSEEELTWSGLMRDDDHYAKKKKLKQLKIKRWFVVFLILGVIALSTYSFFKIESLNEQPIGVDYGQKKLNESIVEGA
jgi:serine/threonine protein phosphatase PrpC